MKSDYFYDITTAEASDLRQQFRSEMNRLLTVERQYTRVQMYKLLGVSRETGPKYLKGQIPTNRPKMLRELLTKAISKLSIELTYRNVKLTAAELQPRESEGERQLELFSQDGFLFEINRKKSARSISLELRIREA
jgi:hypothetical protein